MMNNFKPWKQPIQITRFYSDGTSYLTRATANQLKQFFGLKENDRWPAKGMSTIFVQGITLWVNPLGRILSRSYWGRPNREGPQSRLRALCPECEKEVSYGRLHQHLRVHHQGEK